MRKKEDRRYQKKKKKKNRNRSKYWIVVQSVHLVFVALNKISLNKHSCITWRKTKNKNHLYPHWYKEIVWLTFGCVSCQVAFLFFFINYTFLSNQQRQLGNGEVGVKDKDDITWYKKKWPSRQHGDPWAIQLNNLQSHSSSKRVWILWR